MKKANGEDEFPHFDYNLAQSQLGDFHWIVADKNKYYRISNADEFYRALGYKVEHRKAGVLPDEFVWERYNRDCPLFSKHCLQVLISNYLYKYSGKFRTEFGSRFENWIGKCLSDKIDNFDDQCLACSQHPRFSCK